MLVADLMTVEGRAISARGPSRWGDWRWATIAASNPSTTTNRPHPAPRTVQSAAIPRCGYTEDCADAAVFLCSDQARLITGAVLPVDAGWGVSEGQYSQGGAADLE